LQNAISLSEKLWIQQHAAIMAGILISFAGDMEDFITEPSVAA
jgi:hypothetical protein